MKRLAVDQVVALSVGDVTVDCRVAALTGGEAVVVPLVRGEDRELPAASAGASLVFTHQGRLVMLRGAMYRATSEDDLRFAEKAAGTSKPTSTEQRRKAARLQIALPVNVRAVDARAEATGDTRKLVTRDISIGGFAVEPGFGGLGVGARVSFELTLTNGATLGGTAVVVRNATRMCGLAFENLAPADRVRLAGFLASQQTGRGTRPGAVAASSPR